MKEPDKKELEDQCRKLQQQLDRLLDLVQQLVPEKEYYTAKEVARKKGIDPKTVYNYISKGIYKNVRKVDGHTEIHKSEI